MLVVIQPKDPDQYGPTAFGVLTLLCKMHMPTVKHDMLLHGNNQCQQASLTPFALPAAQAGRPQTGPGVASLDRQEQQPRSQTCRVCTIGKPQSS